MASNLLSPEVQVSEPNVSDIYKICSQDNDNRAQKSKLQALEQPKPRIPQIAYPEKTPVLLMKLRKPREPKT